LRKGGGGHREEHLLNQLAALCLKNRRPIALGYQALMQAINAQLLGCKLPLKLRHKIV